jgi:hypothetical protein
MKKSTRYIVESLQSIRDRRDAIFWERSPRMIELFFEGFSQASRQIYEAIDRLSEEVYSGVPFPRWPRLTRYAQLIHSSPESAFDWVLDGTIEQLTRPVRLIGRKWIRHEKFCMSGASRLETDIVGYEGESDTPFPIDFTFRAAENSRTFRMTLDFSVQGLRMFIEGYLMACESRGFDTTHCRRDLAMFSESLAVWYESKPKGVPATWDHLVEAYGSTDADSTVKLAGEHFRDWREVVFGDASRRYVPDPSNSYYRKYVFDTYQRGEIAKSSVPHAMPPMRKKVLIESGVMSRSLWPKERVLDSGSRVRMYRRLMRGNPR